MSSSVAAEAATARGVSSVNAVTPSYEVRAARALSLVFDDGAVLIWAAVAIELPGVADLAVLLQVQVGHQHLFLFVAGLGGNLAARVDEVARAIEVVVA